MARQRDEGSDSPAPSTNPKKLVRSLDKGFRVLQSFGAAQSGLAPAKAARRAKLDNATAFHLLNTLVAPGHVDRVSGTRRFRPTLQCLDPGFTAGDPHVGGGCQRAAAPVLDAALSIDRAIQAGARSRPSQPPDTASGCTKGDLR